MININDIKSIAKYTRHTSEFEQDGKSYLLNKSLTMAINLTAGTFFEALPGSFAEVLKIDYNTEKKQLSVSYLDQGKIRQKILAYQEDVWIAWIDEV
ncbi:hypothetical protein CUZ56_00251 [Saezia sanguinis]|uniref:Uncharacterized protein n=1 Tax=Saezia sanguinis TaxID=1965230 RepID=A0A433SGJ3_9BURK|nr:hypothetical protein [Saezia sanguinis]RUS67774.1 hypothetical protein CUZ56_00251 [Saezia sanguinis]